MTGTRYHANETAGAQTTLPQYKNEFIESAINIGALTLSQEKELKSKRKSSFFFNMGGYSSGKVTKQLAEAYAHAIKEKFGDRLDEKVIIYGIPEKGVGFAVAVSAALADLGVDSGWCFSRKMPKAHGDATGKPTEFVGRTPKAGDKVILLDDVLTTGETKEEAVATIKKISPEINIIGLIIALDRQEVAIDGKTAVKSFEEKNKVRTESIVNASDISAYITEELAKPEGERNPNVTKKVVSDFQSYMRAYGSDEAITEIGIKLQPPILKEKYGVIPACDGLTMHDFSYLVERTRDVEGIVAYKVGADLINQVGLKAIREAAGKDVTLIVDWQKWGGDIPDMNVSYIKAAKEAGITLLINFPHSGAETQRSAVYRALQEGDITILGGAWMTHPGFEAPIGAFTEEYLLNAYRIWARSGITTFIVPATKPDAVKKIVSAIEEEYGKLGHADIQLTFASPGIGAQGGDTKALFEAIGPRHSVFAIEGRAITTKSTPDASGDLNERAKVAVEKIKKLVSQPVELRS
jgi:orotate phosphoribosyltransferase